MTDPNRKLADEFCGRLSSGNVDTVMEMFASDACVHLMMKAEHFPLKIATDFKTPATIRAYFASAFEAETPHHACRALAVDGNKIFVETVSEATLPGGGLYANNYVFVIEARDGKIVEMREYLDTLLAKQAMEYLLENAKDAMAKVQITG